jgi:hypothetical protein
MKRFWDISEVRYKKHPLKAVGQIRFSNSLIHNKAMFTRGHDWTCPYFPPTVSEILLELDMNDFHQKLFCNFNFKTILIHDFTFRPRPRPISHNSTNISTIFFYLMCEHSVNLLIIIHTFSEHNELKNVADYFVLLHYGIHHPQFC